MRKRDDISVEINLLIRYWFWILEYREYTKDYRYIVIYHATLISKITYKAEQVIILDARCLSLVFHFHSPNGITNDNMFSTINAIISLSWREHIFLLAGFTFSSSIFSGDLLWRSVSFHVVSAFSRSKLQQLRLKNFMIVVEPKETQLN